MNIPALPHTRELTAGDQGDIKLLSLTSQCWGVGLYRIVIGYRQLSNTPLLGQIQQF
jgi:hypothetical protein